MTVHFEYEGTLDGSIEAGRAYEMAVAILQNAVKDLPHDLITHQHILLERKNGVYKVVIRIADDAEEAKGVEVRPILEHLRVFWISYGGTAIMAIWVMICIWQIFENL